MTNDEFNAYFNNARKPSANYMGIWTPRDRVICTDGFSISVQASEHHYSTPRDNDGPYTAVEVGYPIEPEPLLEKYREAGACDSNCIYPYVPVKVVVELIEQHGGVKDCV